jgi:hypothetical protein
VTLNVASTNHCPYAVHCAADQVLTNAFVCINGVIVARVMYGQSKTSPSALHERTRFTLQEPIS